MGRLDETDMGIGDFAMSLMNTGKISKKVQSAEVARPKELPISEVDISETRVSTSMVDKVLHESFGLSNTINKQEVQGPVLTEQELLQEKIVGLKEELVETINKLSSLVSEMAGMTGGTVGGVSTTQSFGPGPANPKKDTLSGRTKRSRVIKRTNN
tara:strand:- start:675 stop:1142 length:468 start_codon:yes stop_codon:yes gene_type:complete